MNVPSRRVRLAQALALVALLAALVGALGPADKVRTTYSWPPATLPEGSPASAWYTPLLLVRHRAETVEASLPCTLPPALPEAARPVTVLATARVPERTGALAVTREGSRLLVRVGREVLTGVELGASSAVAGDCAYALRLAGTRWSLEGGPDEEALAGELERVPVVSGVFSALDLRQGTPPAIELTTFPHASRPTLLQKLAWTLALLCVAAALLLVSLEARPRPWAATRRLARGAVAHAHPADAVVGVVLLGWWVLSPVALDDGWVIARERMFASSGGFSYYYTDFGTNLPIDYWLEWAQHWLAESSLLVVRLPALVCLAAVWGLCRWILARVLPSSVGQSTALWALAATFLVGSLAWGMTVRPEPFTAVFVTAVLACTVRFVERPSAAPLAISAVLLPFALSGHHAAVVGLAPLLLVAPALFRWARAHLAEATAIIPASIALLAVLLFVGADLEQRRTEAVRINPTSESGHQWAEEILRYTRLTDVPPLRRAAVALIALALVAFVVRRRRERRPLLDLPSTSLAVGLVLLIATPSKLPWHFGALLGIAAVAVAAETARLREESRSGGSPLKALTAIGAAVLAIGWSWSAGRSWGVRELRSLDWTLGFERSYSLVTLATVLPLLLLAGAVLVARMRGDKDRLHAPSWRVASWTAVVLAVPLLVFTAAVLAADTAKTDSWTHVRQNLGTLTGDAGCGAADGLLVAAPQSARALEPSALEPSGLASSAVPAWVPPPPVEGLPRFALGPGEPGAQASSPWFLVPDEGRVGVFMSGVPARDDLLELEWGRLRDGGVQSLGSGEIPDELASEAGATLPWWFVAAGELPPRPSEANAVRVTFASDVTPGSPLAVTAPVTYASEPLRQSQEAEGSRTLVFTDMLLYFTCAELPLLHDGVVDPPHQIVVDRDWPSPISDSFTSPFAGILDLYRLERLPLADAEHTLGTIAIFGVDRRIPGALEAPPDATAFEG